MVAVAAEPVESLSLASWSFLVGQSKVKRSQITDYISTESGEMIASRTEVNASAYAHAAVLFNAQLKVLSNQNQGDSKLARESRNLCRVASSMYMNALNTKSRRLLGYYGIVRALSRIRVNF